MELDCPLCGTTLSTDLSDTGLDEVAEAEWDVLRSALDVHWNEFCPGEDADEAEGNGSGLRRGAPDMEMV